ncbi:methyltransferase domain-containing protein [Nocardia sp. NPDC050718]|uniref:methyltransferase domain-containing protein n=1 Tax=unclassified Nocardia TaxID=2637762 RepID=UPI0033E0B681
MAVPDDQLPSFHVDAAGAADDLLITLLDRQAELSGVVRMRRWVLDVLAPRPGDTALDIGSGTGSEVLAFAARVGPHGRAVGVDANPAMLTIARERARGTAAEFAEGTAAALPLPDDSVDLVRCERVFQHLDDPAAATAEIARVLRPGGRVCLVDSDWYTAILHPGDPAVVAALSERMRADTANPGSGRRLRGLLVRAGFVIDDQASQAVIWDADTAIPLVGQMVATGRATGVITAAQADELTAAIAHGVATGDYHMSVTMFAVLAHRP